MDAITENLLFEYHPNTLQNVRKIYGLDTPELVNESVDRLQEWIHKANHFKKKDFSRDYLEKIIIGSKGSVERAKERLEKICMLRTIAPMFFGLHRANYLTGLEVCLDTGLPKLTKNYYRVYLIKGNRGSFGKEFIQNYCKRLVLFLEYWMKYDYSKGVIGVIDARDTNMVDFIKVFAVPEIARHVHMFFECYVARLQAMHILISSNVINAVFAVLKTTLSPKIYQRFYLHNSLESLHEVFEKDILPVEYGGKEESLIELHQRCKDYLSTDEFMETIKEMQNATIDTALKSIEDFGDTYNLGLAGTFRKLNVD